MSDGPANGPALAELCRLLEQSDRLLLPDALWLSGQLPLYEHLRTLGVLHLAPQTAPAVTCPECTTRSIRPERRTAPDDAGLPYRAYCLECGWIDLAPDQVRLWQTDPAQVAVWLNRALGLQSRCPVTPLIDGVLWHLGEREFRRHRRSLFFGCRLATAVARVEAELERWAAPGAEAVITTSDPLTLPPAEHARRRWIPLRAVAQLRKSQLVLDHLDAYFTDPPPPEPSEETSLRPLHSHQAVLIHGRKVALSPQVYGFLSVLEEAEGDEVHKRVLADALQIPETFRSADLFKRHREVLATFIAYDRKGQYWLKPEFLLPDRE